MVPEEGFEPPLPREHDPKSCTSTSSVTPAKDMEANVANFPLKIILVFSTPDLSRPPPIFNHKQEWFLSVPFPIAVEADG